MNLRTLGAAAAAMGMFLPAAASAQPLGPGLERPGAASAFLVEPIAEKAVTALPPAPLYWRVERYPSLTQAR